MESSDSSGVKDQVQKAIDDLRAAGEKATGDVRSSIDSAVARLRDVSGGASEKAQDQLSGWRETLDKATEDAASLARLAPTPHNTQPFRILPRDERTADRFSLDAGDQERLYYGFSVLHCLPVGMTEPDSAGTGTVMRPDTVRDYATEAGFVDVKVVPIEHDLWRFYLLAA